MAIGDPENSKIPNYVTVITKCHPYHPAALGSSLESLYGKSGPAFIKAQGVPRENCYFGFRRENKCFYGVEPLSVITL